MRILRKLIDNHRRNKLYRETYATLSQLSDKDLKDIGLNRGEIHRVSMEAYHRRVV